MTGILNAVKLAINRTQPRNPLKGIRVKRTSVIHSRKRYFYVQGTYLSSGYYGKTKMSLMLAKRIEGQEIATNADVN